jgi:acyl carrier protein
MTQSDTLVRGEVERIFREVFEEPDMALETGTSREQLPDWDSVAQVKLVLAVEKAFSIQCTVAEVASIHTLGEFVEAVAKHSV